MIKLCTHYGLGVTVSGQIAGEKLGGVSWQKVVFALDLSTTSQVVYTFAPHLSAPFRPRRTKVCRLWNPSGIY